MHVVAAIPLLTEQLDAARDGGFDQQCKLKLQRHRLAKCCPHWQRPVLVDQRTTLVIEGQQLSVVEHVRRNRAELREQLRAHGALLLREFTVSGIDGFAAVVRVLSGEALTYSERSLRRDPKSKGTLLLSLTTSGVRCENAPPYNSLSSRSDTGTSCTAPSQTCSMASCTATRSGQRFLTIRPRSSRPPGRPMGAESDNR